MWAAQHCSILLISILHRPDRFQACMPEKINLSAVIHTGISDHSLIYGIRKINPIISSRKAKKFEVRNMKWFNQRHFNEDFLAQPWEQIVLQSDTDSRWALWKELFVEVLDKYAPLQHIRKKSSCIPWLAKRD